MSNAQIILQLVGCFVSLFIIVMLVWCGCMLLGARRDMEKAIAVTEGNIKKLQELKDMIDSFNARRTP